ncbi:MAG: bifunctional (p)ppGpp synthetase/guanosine-3',5'-bis(diphosphate) 3'-pyrophosphohydrolase [Steroidobacteraceae bacterium]
METAQRCSPAIRARIAALRATLEAIAPMRSTELDFGAEAAEVLGALTDDVELALAVLAHSAFSEGDLDSAAASVLEARTVRLAQDLARLGELGLAPQWTPARGLDARQAETLRKMLLAVVSDPRLVLARLAVQLVRMRRARALTAPERERLAIETRAVFAPLANRLGVWQLKWELEDLAFRYLDSEEYKRLASALNERRADRERYIESLCEELHEELAQTGVEAEIYGRPKHIYSIHRKMQRKQLAFERIFDVRALRIVVATVPDCYTALGVVHARWPYVPGEFDDYIATPKDNFYRSIHTAVIGPEGRSVEIQIRTREMHDHAELGVAAHWQYKEGGTRNVDYERKIQWVRRLLEPQDAADADRDFVERVRAELFEDRVYALTPKGEVVDLPRGATPLDFAYHVHTDLGHRCRGAKINGRIVPLTTPIANGEIIEIITGRHAAPSRDWLAPEQGFLASPRNRAKVRAWFRKQDAGDNRTAGRAIAERELARVGAGPDLFAAIVQELKARDADQLYQLLGEGEITATQLVQAASRLARPAGAPTFVPRRPRSAVPRRGSPVEIEGVGDLPITLARCCGPMRPQPIGGYVTLGRGVTIHRANCASFKRMRAAKAERTLNVEWSEHDVDALAVELAISAYDRRGLVRDLSDVLALERLSIEAMTTTTDRGSGTAQVTVSVAVHDLEQLARVLRRLSAVSNVIHARRVR